MHHYSRVARANHPAKFYAGTRANEAKPARSSNKLSLLISKVDGRFCYTSIRPLPLSCRSAVLARGLREYLGPSAPFLFAITAIRLEDRLLLLLETRGVGKESDGGLDDAFALCITYQAGLPPLGDLGRVVLHLANSNLTRHEPRREP